MPTQIEMSRVLFIEADYSSKILFESSKNPQRYDTKHLNYYNLNSSNKLNAKATCNMLTLRCMFLYQNETKTIGIHVFQQIKDPYSAWESGRKLIMKKTKDLGLEFDRLIRVSILFCFRFFVFTLKITLIFIRFVTIVVAKTNHNID